MDLQSIQNDTEESINFYISHLGNFTEEEFTKKHTDDVWSLSQLYYHLYTTSNFYFMANCLRAIEHRKGQEGGEKVEVAVKMFLKNSFPPIKIKVPNADFQTLNGFKVQEEFKEILMKILVDSKNLEGLINLESNYKVASFNLGFLNAFEWFQLHAMHLRHHRTQFEELKSYLSH